MRYCKSPFHGAAERLCSAATSFTTLLLLATTALPPAFASDVRATSSNDFLDSTCVNTGLSYLDRVYGNYPQIKASLVDLGMRHIRDSGTSGDWISKIKDLANSGIKTTVTIDPVWAKIVPNADYKSKISGSVTVNELVKKVGTNVIDAVEGINEIDLNYGEFPNLNNDPSSANYWGKYARTTAIDTWNAIKNDSATSGVKVLGPTLARWYDKGSTNPIGSLSAYVDWGNFHPYPFNGNPYGDRSPYDGIDQYYLNANFPSQNIDEYPFSFEVYARPFNGKPMAATETGYYTSGAEKAISEKVQAKYMPRLFLEYFRLGIARTCAFELVDGGKHTTEHWGLLHNDLSPKPAYTALKNLFGLLADDGGGFTPGSLNYTFSIEPPSGYDRTNYVHSLLLQKSNGKYYLAIWHEISNNDLSSNPPRELNPPSVPTTINFSSSIASAKLYSLGADGSMTSSGLSVRGRSEISLTTFMNIKEPQR